MRENFNVKEVADGMIEFIKDWHRKNNLENAPTVIGVSGGKDSSACLAALVKARGAEKVIAVLMPNGEQKDINDSIRVCEHFGVNYITINIGPMYEALTNSMRVAVKNGSGVFPNAVYSTNTPARLRMVILYGVAALNHGVVVNTCNLSEDYVGWSTKWGDSVGDYSLLGKLFVSEVIAVGKYLGVPEDLMKKTPSDGMCGSSDEEKMGFSYNALEEYIKNENDLSKALITVEAADKISKLHNNPNTVKKLVIKDEDIFKIN